jgi:predicted SAM-dependent methyltransferase
MTNTDLRVVVGSGGSKNNVGWLHTEESELNLLKRSDWEERFFPNSISVVLAEHVWEHFTYEDGIDAAKICYEFLRPGGYIRCAVPDGYFRTEWYQNLVKVGGLVQPIIQPQVIK